MIALLLSLALAAEPAAPAAPEANAAEVQDLILLHEEGPLRMRVRIGNGNKTVFGQWHDHIDRWFKYIDRDASGLVDAGEMERMPSLQQMQYMLANGQFYAAQQLAGVAGQGAVALKDLDLDNDGKIDRHEFVTYYANSLTGPLQVVAGYSAAAAQGYGNGTTSDSLFRAMDTDRDGKLSRAELARASGLLARFDVDDDEIVTARELVGTNPIGQQFGQPGQVANLALMPLPREANDRRLTGRLKFAKDLVTRLDTNRNTGLEPAEFRIAPAEFAKLDRNRDGQLDALELVVWLTAGPDIEVTVRLDTLLAEDPVVVATGKNVEPGKATANGLNFRVGDASIQFDRNPAAPNRAMNAGANMKQYFVQIFNLIDTQKTGKVTLEEINKNPQAAYLRTMNKWLDMDGDGSVTLKELDDFIELTSGGAQAQLTIGFLDQGRGLFELLDTLADGQLSIGELRSAGKILAGYIKEGKDTLERTDLPRRYQMVVARGSNGNQMQMMGGVAGVRPVQPNAVRQPGRGPMWFQKMDINGDGYVSPREFLGPMPMFQGIDADRDGLVSADEAIRYDETRRKPEAIGEEPMERR